MSVASCRPLAASHTRAVLSPLAVTMRCPSGENAAEITKLDGLALSGIELFQCSEAGIKCQEIATSLLPEDHSLFKGHTQSCPLSSVSAASVIHQNLAHEPGGHAKKMRPILPIRSVLFHKPQVGLVYEGRRLEGMAVAFFAEIAGC